MRKLSVPSPSSPLVRQTIADRVRQCLSRHGLSDTRQQITALMGIMDASYSQVYRKISGRSSWVEEDLHRIVEHFGETLGTLFADSASTDGSSVRWLEAEVMVGAAIWPCEVQLNDRDPVQGDLVLQRQGTKWLVTVLQQAPDSSVKGCVARLRMDGQSNATGGFAVFDDDPSIVDTIVDHLSLKGIPAQAFYAVNDLQRCSRRFDTYILDWYSHGDSTVMDLVKHLKESHAPDATVVILTGQIQRGRAEADLSNLIHSHAVMVELKPIRIDLLLAKIEASHSLRAATVRKS